MPKKSDKKQKLDIPALVDELGALRAQESALGDRDKEISAALVGALGWVARRREPSSASSSCSRTARHWTRPP